MGPKFRSPSQNQLLLDWRPLRHKWDQLVAWFQVLALSALLSSRLLRVFCHGAMRCPESVDCFVRTDHCHKAWLSFNFPGSILGTISLMNKNLIGDISYKIIACQLFFFLVIIPENANIRN